LLKPRTFVHLHKRGDAARSYPIACAFDEEILLRRVVNKIDLRLLATESRDLMSDYYDHTGELEPYPWKIIEVPIPDVKRVFLEVFNKLI